MVAVQKRLKTTVIIPQLESCEKGVCGALIPYKRITLLASSRFQGFLEKKRLNARGFAREFLWSSMLYRPGKSLKNAANLLVCTRKKVFCLGGALFL